MKIRVNGQFRELEDAKTLQDFITQNVRNTKHLVAEVNGDIVKPPHWEETQLQEGDSLEIVTLFGGG